MTVLSEAILPGDFLQPPSASVREYSFPYVGLFPHSSTILVNRDELSDDAREMLSKIRSFSSLNSSWDSYGAEPPSTVAVGNAFSFVRAIDRKREPVYFTAPGPNGEILVELKRGNRSVEITFEPDGTSTYAKFLGDDCVEENTFENQATSQLTDWLSS